jgi:hypothetical protein
MRILITSNCIVKRHLVLAKRAELKIKQIQQFQEAMEMALGASKNKNLVKKFRSLS